MAGKSTDLTREPCGMDLESATEPWKSTDAGDWIYYEGRWVHSDLSAYDDQAQIELCLRCRYADDCHDCLSHHLVGGAGAAGKRARGRPSVLTELLDQLILDGGSIRSIAKATGISKSAVGRRKRELEVVAK